MTQDVQKKRRLALALFFTLIAVTFAISQMLRHGAFERLQDSRPPVAYEETFSVFGTYGKLTLWAEPDIAEPCAEKVITSLQSLHNRLNLFDPDSELSRLNDKAGEEFVECSPQLWDLLTVCREGYIKTNGAFDITVGPLMQLWGFHGERKTLPTSAEIRNTLDSVGMDKVLFEDSRQAVKLTKPGMYLDFGGVAKGYAVDLAARIMTSHTITMGLIDLGGNIRCLSNPPPGKQYYSVGIRHPFDKRNLLGTVHVTNSAIATSGNYEQSRRLEGELVHHIVDPRTGQPVRDVASVTVITPCGADSDIFSTAVFVDGPALARTLKDATRRTSILRVELDERGEAHVDSYGWVWQDVSLR